MGGGESTNSSQSVSKPLTAAERQDLYRSSIGNILNTYVQSGLPYGGVGSMNGMNATNATFTPYAAPATQTYSGIWKTLAPAVQSVQARPSASSGQAASSGQIAQTGDQTNGLYNASGTGEQSRAQSRLEDYRAPLDFFNQTHGAPDPTVNMPTGARDPGGINLPVYQTPQYQTPGQFQAGGYTAGLDYAKGQDTERLNSDLAKRGIWSSGLAEKAMGDLSAGYAPAYEKAGADQATAQNAYNLTGAQNANNFNVTNANNAYQAGWTPLEYLRNLWSGTSGQTSGSSSFGQSLNVEI
jgi:hypothetical protein